MELLLSRKGIEYDFERSRYDVFKSLKGFEVQVVLEYQDMDDYLEDVVFFSTYRKARAFVKSEIAMEIEDLG